MEFVLNFLFYILGFKWEKKMKQQNFVNIYIYEWFAYIIAMFVFWKVISEKLLFKLSCVCLLLKKLVNGKHFPVKEKFNLIFRKVFFWKMWAENTFWKL
jgi:hypothetical protein